MDESKVRLQYFAFLINLITCSVVARGSAPMASLFGKDSQDSPPPKCTSTEQAKTSATIPTDHPVLRVTVLGTLLSWRSDEGRRAQVSAVGDWG